MLESSAEVDTGTYKKLKIFYAVKNENISAIIPRCINKVASWEHCCVEGSNIGLSKPWK